MSFRPFWPVEAPRPSPRYIYTELRTNSAPSTLYLRLRAFSITWIRGTYGWTANGLLPLVQSSAARVGTNPPAEAVEEVSAFGRPSAYVISASEELNLIARVCAFAIEQFVANGTPAEWRKIANESTPGNAARPVSLNPVPKDAGKTAKKVFEIILKRCDNRASEVFNLTARDREVIEERGRGQGHKLQPRLQVFGPAELDGAAEAGETAAPRVEPPSCTISFSSCMGGVAPVTHTSSALFVEGMVLGEPQVTVLLQACIMMYCTYARSPARTAGWESEVTSTTLVSRPICYALRVTFLCSRCSSCCSCWCFPCSLLSAATS